MLAIYKKELKSYFTSVIACLFIAVTTLIAGIFFIYYNLTYGLADMYSAYNALMILVFTVPILTMKIIADEKRLKTDQLILSAPISVGKIVMGKYLALLTIFIIPVLVMCIYPIILSAFGTVSFGMAYTNILGLFLYGSALIAIGVFISSITESQVISAILSIVILFVGYIMESITTMISSTENIITKVLGCFDLLTPANEFMSGIISLKYIVYYITIIVLFLFLTCQSIQKRRWNISKNTISTGVFSTTYIVVVLVLTIVVNLVATKITDNVSAASIDMTSAKLYSITENTKKMLAGVENDITVYVMVSEKNADETVKKTLENFERESKHIKIEYKDTTLNPNFYTAYTDTAPTSNSLIVVNEDNGKSKVVDYSEIYIADSSSYYYTGSTTYTGYDCEGLLDSAISYVSSESNPVIYQIEGHDEIGMGEEFTAALEKMNCAIESIKLPSMDKIEVDACEFILILGPTTDYSKDDAQKVIDYLKAGGKAIIACENYQSADVDKPNFESILNEVGITCVDGVLAENDSNYYTTSYGPFYMFADGMTGYATDLASYLMIPYAKGLQQTDADDDSVAYTSLATSSEAVSKTDVANATTYEKEKDDIDGQFDLAVFVAKTYTTESEDNEETANEETDASEDTENTNTIQANVLALSSVYILDDGINEAVSGSNLEMFTNTIEDFVDTDVETISVPAKDIQTTSLTVTASASKSFGFFIAIILPFAVLGIGIFVWIRRRKM